MGSETVPEQQVSPLISLPSAGLRDARPGLSGVPADELIRWLTDRGQPTFRARQLSDHVWSAAAQSSEQLSTIPQRLRAELDDTYRVSTLAATDITAADGGLTQKALHTLDDGMLIESVLMRYPARGWRRARATVCISSQAGCAVGCPFCATGELGFGRDLDVAEMVDQVRFWRLWLAGVGQRLTNVVFMGMGEPLLNTDRVIAAAAAITDPARFGLGARHVTISTSGVVPGMDRLTTERPQYTLAVSLHAARNELRDVLVPLNRRYPVAEVLRAADRYADATRRRVTYEYVMIDAINDTAHDAEALAEILEGRLAHVNLIPMNPVAHTPWGPSSSERTEAFAARLREAGIETTVRRNRGVDIGAACGQLAANRAGAPAPAAVARRRELLVLQSAAALGATTHSH
jgi:23S rRNA (adenine2503-C2)-methyltransferase